jgi:GPH family glycoside/pentoside/hexuronide:cation symporter
MSPNASLTEAERAAALRRGKVGFGLIAAYGSGTLADSVTQTALNFFLFFYLTAVCGMSNSLAGLSGLVALCVDAMADPLVGALSDNSWSRLGRRHPFMFAGVGPLALGLGLLFSLPSGLSPWSLFAYATGVSILLRVSHSTFFLPYVGLGAELSDDYAERTNVVTSRFLFSVVGAAACLVLGQSVFMGGPGGLMHRAAYAPFGWTCGAIVLAGGLATSFGTLGALKRLRQLGRPQGPLVTRLLRDFVELFRNPSFIALFLSLLLMFTGLGVVTSLTLHANTFFWRLPSSVIQIVLLSNPAGVLIGALISLAFIRRFEKRSVVIAGFVVIIAIQALLPLLRLMGWLPDGPALHPILIGAALLSGTIGAIVAIAFQSAMADAADEHEHMFGTRRESLYYAGLNLSAKAAGGLGVFLAGIALDLIRFPTNLAAHGGVGATIPAGVLTRFGLIFGPGAAVIYALAMIVFLFYRLDRRRHEHIQQELDERRRTADVIEAASIIEP